jgi:hypothetical protein
MVRVCPHRRPVTPVAPVVRGPQDALQALSAATDRGRTLCVAVGALTVARRPVVLVVVEGAAAPELPSVLDLVLAGTTDVTAAVFVATCGRSPALPGAALVGDAEQRCVRWGVDLLEWFVPVGGGWVAVCNGPGRAGRW